MCKITFMRQAWATNYGRPYRAGLTGKQANDTINTIKKGKCVDVGFVRSLDFQLNIDQKRSREGLSPLLCRPFETIPNRLLQSFLMI